MQGPRGKEQQRGVSDNRAAGSMDCGIQYKVYSMSYITCTAEFIFVFILNTGNRMTMTVAHATTMIFDNQNMDDYSLRMIIPIKAYPHHVQ